VIFPVEVKLNIDASGADALGALLQTSLPPTKRQIWFAEGRAGVEAGTLPLFTSHVIVRLRSGEETDDLTVKLRPCIEQQLIGRWDASFETKSLEYRIEGDWSGERRTLAASAVNESAPGSLLEMVGAFADPADAMTSKQRQFLNQCAPPDVEIDRLVALGPIDSTKWADVVISGLVVNVERWLTQEFDFIELSLRVKPNDEETLFEFESRVTAKLRALENAARDSGLPIDTHNDTKTQRVLATLARIQVHN